MKKTLILLAVTALATINFSWAQSSDDYFEIARSVLKTEKKAAIAEVMELTDAESGPFWELYNEYTEAAYKLGTQEVNLITDYAKNYENMTNEKADEIWTSAMNVEMQKLKLQKKYYKKFKKILPAGKAARFFQAENKIEAMINAQMASEIPIIEVK